MKRALGVASFIALLAIVTLWPGRVGAQPARSFGAINGIVPGIFAQVTSGYTLLATVPYVAGTTAYSYKDTTCPVGSQCSYEATAYNSVGQSTAAGPVTSAATSSATPNVLLSWTAATSGATPTGYDIYTAARVPNGVTGFSAAPSN